MEIWKFVVALSVTIFWLTIEGANGSAYVNKLPETTGLRKARNILVGGPGSFPMRNARDMSENWPIGSEHEKTNPPPGAFNPVWGWSGDSKGWTSLGWIAVQSTCTMNGGWGNNPTVTTTSTLTTTETDTVTSIIPTTSTEVITSTVHYTETTTQTLTPGWGWDASGSTTDITEIITILPSSDINIVTSTDYETIIVTSTPTFVDTQQTLSIQCTFDVADTTITLPFSITPDLLVNTVYESSTSTDIVDTKYVSISGWGSVTTEPLYTSTTTIPSTFTVPCTTACTTCTTASNSKDCKFGWCRPTPSCPTTTCYKTVTTVLTAPPTFLTYTGEIIQTFVSVSSTAILTTTSTLAVEGSSTATSVFTNTLNSINPVSTITTITTSNPVTISQSSAACTGTTYTDISSMVHIGTVEASTITLTSTAVQCVTPTITRTSTEFSHDPLNLSTTTSTILASIEKSTSTITTIIPIHPSSTTTLETVSTKYLGMTSITPAVTKTITATSTVYSTPIATTTDIGTHSLTKNTKITSVAEVDTLLTTLTPTVVQTVVTTITPDINPTLTTTILEVTQSVTCPGGWSSGWGMSLEDKRWWH